MFEKFFMLESESIKAKIIRDILANENDSGRYGKAFEIALKTATNNTVAGHNKTDKKMAIIDNNGKKHFASVEIKTNGGRIDDINNSDYIIYAMDICNSTTKGNRRIAEPIIMKTETFMAILKKCGAIKTVNKGGMLDGYAIQVSNKAFYEAMVNYPNKFILGKTYHESEIA